MKILIVDDDALARRQLAHILTKLGAVQVLEAESLATARAVLEEEKIIDVALLDVRLDQDPENRDGLLLVQDVRARSGVPIVVTGIHEMGEVRAAMRLGAHDYVLKDEISEELVLPIVESLRNQRRLEREVVMLRARRDLGAGPDLIGTSPPILALREMIARVSVSDRPVLVTGPTGSGKELVVRAIHAAGAHPEAPLLDLNCGAFPESLIESQLFGHERGAFTGADKKREGFFSAVGEGTLFLDEIAELPLELQAKLLRVLETKTFRPVGSITPQHFAGRVVSATHVDLSARVAERRFREDLLYRLNVLELRVPSLEERPEDIPALVVFFAEKLPNPPVFTEAAMAHLRRMPWPGNVRQLRNLVDRLAVFAPGAPITPEVIDRFSGRGPAPSQEAELMEVAAKILRRTEPDKIELMTNALIDEALRLADGNKSGAARLLGVHRKFVERRVDRSAPLDS